MAKKRWNCAHFPSPPSGARFPSSLPLTLRNTKRRRPPRPGAAPTPTPPPRPLRRRGQRGRGRGSGSGRGRLREGPGLPPRAEGARSTSIAPLHPSTRSVLDSLGSSSPSPPPSPAISDRDGKGRAATAVARPAREAPACSRGGARQGGSCFPVIVEERDTEGKHTNNILSSRSLILSA